MYYFVRNEKYLHTPRLIFIHFTCLCSLLQWSWKMSIIKVTEALQYFLTNENDVRFEYVPWKNVILFHFHCLGSL